jgi:hypothetical protein
MKLGRAWRKAALVALVGAALLPACSRRKPADVNDITPSFSVNRKKAPLDSAIEVTYTWTVGPGVKRLGKDYRALVHFVDGHNQALFDDDHLPPVPTGSWEAGKTYTYTRTKFIPIYPYLGDISVRMGLYKDRERVGLKGEDAGMQEYKVATMELVPQTENIFHTFKEGWHSPESFASNPGQQHTWTKKEAVVAFKNPKKDVIVYLEADTNYKAFSQPPVLTISVGGTRGITVPIQSSDLFLKKVRFKASDLGDQDWSDLRLTMNQSFVPKQLNPPLNQDERELALLVYNLYIAEADKIGTLPAEQVVDAGPVTAPAAHPGAGKGNAKATPVALKTGAKAAPAPTPKPQKP